MFHYVEDGVITLKCAHCCSAPRSVYRVHRSAGQCCWRKFWAGLLQWHFTEWFHWCLISVPRVNVSVVFVTRLQDCSHILDGVKASILIAMSRDLVLWDTVHCSVDEKLCLLVLCLEWLSEPLFWTLGLSEGAEAIWCLLKSLWSVCVVHLLQGRRGMRDRRGGESQRRTREQCKLNSASLLLWRLFFLKRALTCRNQPKNILKAKSRFVCYTHLWVPLPTLFSHIFLSDDVFLSILTVRNYMQIKETCCLFFLVVENWWDKISLAVTREDRRKYSWWSNASSWKSTPDCFAVLYIAFLRSVKGHFGDEKHSWHYGPTTLKDLGFSCRNSSLPFLLGSFCAPMGWKGCGECHHFKHDWERTAFPCHRSGWM